MAAVVAALGPEVRGGEPLGPLGGGLLRLASSSRGEREQQAVRVRARGDDGEPLIEGPAREGQDRDVVDPAVLARFAVGAVAHGDHVPCEVDVREVLRPLLAFAHARPEGEGDEAAAFEGDRLARDERGLLLGGEVRPRVVGAGLLLLRKADTAGGVRLEVARFDGGFEGASKEVQAVLRGVVGDFAILRLLVALPGCGLLPKEFASPLADVLRADRSDVPVCEIGRVDVPSPAGSVGLDVAVSAELALVQVAHAPRSKRQASGLGGVRLADLHERGFEQVLGFLVRGARAEARAGPGEAGAERAVRHLLDRSAASPAAFVLLAHLFIL
ncbi:hypothetical protein [Polyangium sp. 15x6]|uniref:hypothetical protein n=1 Tax=Polyangium sp. 15x6 TaxID=3042687 RepID=UPI00249BA7E8|nr:hypothetical protein [Polyangium sp. 15x6]